MKTRRFIVRKLISGKLKLTPEVLRGLKELGAGEGKTAPTPKPGEFLKPKQPADDKPASEMNGGCDSWRLVFVSPHPGRWIRCGGAAVACVCLMLAGSAFAADGAGSFNAANEAFVRGEFAEAARGFESVLAREGHSAPVLYNLANAQFRDGKAGVAILNYERALALAPNDPDIVTNLRAARAKAVVGANETSGLSRFARSLSLNGWATFAAVSLFVGCAAILLRRRLSAVRAGLGLTGAFSTLAFVAGVAAIAHRWPELNRAVVIATECTAGVAPVTTAESVFRLPEGEAVAIRQTRGPFALVQSREGRSGWVRQEQIRQVLTSATGRP